MKEGFLVGEYLDMLLPVDRVKEMADNLVVLDRLHPPLSKLQAIVNFVLPYPHQDHQKDKYVFS